MPSLKLEDFSDRELLFALEDYADGDGLVTSEALAQGLGLSFLKHPTQSVAIRLSWLRRYGVVRRDEETGQWGLTAAGESILHGHLTKGQERALEALDPDQLAVLVSGLGSKFALAGPEARTMAARQWRYQMAADKRQGVRR